FLVPLLVVPTLGAALVQFALRWAGVTLTYGKCWKAHLAACCYSYLALMPLGWFINRAVANSGSTIAPGNLQLVHLGLFCLSHVAIVPLWLNHFPPRALGLQGAAVILSNLLTFVLVMQLRAGG